MTATLRIMPVPGLADVKQYEVDCPHATTTAYAINPQVAGITDADCVRMALAKHDDEEGCGCTASLWRRYGIEVTR